MNYRLILAILAASSPWAMAENVYLNAPKSASQTLSFSSAQTWRTAKGALGRPAGADDAIHMVFDSQSVNVDGDFTVKQIDLARFVGQLCPDNTLVFNMSKTAPGGKDGSLTVDSAKPPKAKGANNTCVLSASFAGVEYSKDEAALKKQVFATKGGSVRFLNSKDPNGVLFMNLTAQLTQKTKPDYYGEVKFDSPVSIENDLVVSSRNKVYADTIGYQVCKLSFLDKTMLYSPSSKKFKNFKVAKLPTNYFTPLMRVSVGDPTHRDASMRCGGLWLDFGSQLSVYGSLEINGDLNISWSATLNVEKGAKLAITSKNIGKAVGVKSKYLARMRIDGAFVVDNPKILGENTVFHDCQIHVGPTGSIRVDGSGIEGRNALMLDRSLLSLQKGAKVYARNMVRLGTQSRLQLFGENQIKSIEPANGLCRLYLAGPRAIVELHANQHFDGFYNSFPVTLRLGDEVSNVRFAKLVQGKWGKKMVITIEGFKNGVVKIDADDPMIKTNIAAKGWKNFRLENGFLTADKI